MADAMIEAEIFVVFRMYIGHYVILLLKKIKGKPYSVRHYRGFPKLFLENQALLGFHEAKTGVECGSWAYSQK